MPHSRNSLIEQFIVRAVNNAEHQCSNVAGALNVVADYVAKADERGQIVTDEHIALGEALSKLVELSNENLAMLKAFQAVVE